MKERIDEKIEKYLGEVRTSESNKTKQDDITKQIIMQLQKNRSINSKNINSQTVFYNTEIGKYQVTVENNEQLIIAKKVMKNVGLKNPKVYKVDKSGGVVKAFHLVADKR